MIALALSLLLSSAHAERPLTYQEALSAAVQHHPSLISAQASTAQAEGSLLSARGTFDPRYDANGSWRHSRNVGFFQGFPFTSRSNAWSLSQALTGSAMTGTTYALNTSLDRNYSEFTTDFGLGQSNTQIQDAYTANVNASITQSLLKGVRFKYNVQNVTLARQALTTAELAQERARQDAMYQAAEAYWSWVYQSELMRIAEESVRVAEEALRVGQLQVQSGQLAPVEATRLEAALIQAQQSALDANNQREQAADTLLLAMGEDPTQAVQPATPAGNVPTVQIDPVAAVEVALSQNLDLAVARANLETAEITLANSKHAALPTLNATGSAGIAAQDTSSGAAVSGLLDADNQPFVSVSGQFSVPLGNRAARGERDRAAAVVLQREQELLNQERRVQATTDQQVRTLSSAGRRMELADINLRLAEETLRAEEALAKAGRAIQRNVLEARTELDRARANAAKSRTDYRLAQAQLLRQQGQLTEQAP